ncbi:UNVERIFIED_CONTAM: hypothetical protein FKN15_066978 [Acipenser sinensis]
MGLFHSSYLDAKQRKYLAGRTVAVLKNFIPHYQRQSAAAYLEHVRNEVEQRGGESTQLLYSQVQRGGESTQLLYSQARSTLLLSACQICTSPQQLRLLLEESCHYTTDRNLRSPDCVTPPPCTPRGRAFTRGDPRGPLRSPDCVTPPCTPRGRAFTRGDPRGPLRSPDCVTPPCTPRGRAFTRGDPRGPLRSPDCVTPPCTPRGRAFTRGDPRGPLRSPDCVTPPCTPRGRAFTRGDPRGPLRSPDCVTPPCTPRGRAFTRGDPRGPLRSPDCVTPPCTPRGRAFTRGDPRGPLRSPDCVTPPCTPRGRAFTRGDPRGPRVLKEQDTLQLPLLVGRIRPNLDQIVELQEDIAGRLADHMSAVIERGVTRSVSPSLLLVLQKLAPPLRSGFTGIRQLFTDACDDIIRTGRCGQSAQEGLAQYEEMVFADYSTVIHIENIYEDVVVQALMKEINEVLTCIPDCTDQLDNQLTTARRGSSNCTDQLDNQLTTAWRGSSNHLSDSSTGSYDNIPKTLGEDPGEQESCDQAEEASQKTSVLKTERPTSQHGSDRLISDPDSENACVFLKTEENNATESSSHIEDQPTRLHAGDLQCLEFTSIADARELFYKQQQALGGNRTDTPELTIKESHRVAMEEGGMSETKEDGGEHQNFEESRLKGQEPSGDAFKLGPSLCLEDEESLGRVEKVHQVPMEIRDDRPPELMNHGFDLQNGGGGPSLDPESREHVVFGKQHQGGQAELENQLDNGLAVETAENSRKTIEETRPKRTEKEGAGSFGYGGVWDRTESPKWV